MTPATATADFAKRLDQTAEETEALLGQLLSDALLPDEIARPKRLMEAMRYSSLGGGKRLRGHRCLARTTLSSAQKTTIRAAR